MWPTGACIRQVLLNLLSNAIKFTTDGEATVMVSFEERTGPSVVP